MRQRGQVQGSYGRGRCEKMSPNPFDFAQGSSPVPQIHRFAMICSGQDERIEGMVPRPCDFCKGGYDAADRQFLAMYSGLHRTYGTAIHASQSSETRTVGVTRTMVAERLSLSTFSMRP